jgi:hypothetical protein
MYSFLAKYIVQRYQTGRAVEETKERSLLHAIVGELDKTTLTNKTHIALSIGNFYLDKRAGNP